MPPDTLATMAAVYHLAQVNVATALAPLDDASMSGFAARLVPLNELADGSPGFVWRLQSEEADALAARLFDNPRLLFNLTLWDSVEALEAYVYRSDHLNAVTKRSQWFERPRKPPLALWWVKAGHRPSVEEAKERIERLWREGPTPSAFNFRTRFPAPGSTTRPQGRREGLADV